MVLSPGIRPGSADGARSAPARRLVVEVDGSFHEMRRGADAHRDAALASAGYRVLRLEAHVVLAAPAIAVERIREALR